MSSPEAEEVGRWPVAIRDSWASTSLTAIAGPSGAIRLSVRDGTRLRIFEPDETAGFGFPFPSPAYAVSPDLAFAVFGGAQETRAVNADGSLRWSVAAAYGARGSMTVSADGRLIWATLPAAVTADRVDHWLVLDAASGAVLDEVSVDAAASGSDHLRHPDGVHVGLGIGEGQEGSMLLWGRFEDGHLHHRRGEDDLVLAGISPAGDTFLTIAHEQEDATLHAFPSGATIWTAPGDLIPREPHDDEDDLHWDYYAGFVDAATIMLSDVEYDPDEVAGHFLVDVATGRALGAVGYPVEVTGYPCPLGDGTWLTATADEVVRWRTAG